MEKMETEEVPKLNFPPKQFNYSGNKRKVGVELEFTGLELDDIADILYQHFNGDLEKKNPYHYFLHNTSLGGPFIMEIDALLLKEMVIQGYLENLGITMEDDYKFRDAIDKLLKEVAESVVPYEVATPPIYFEELKQIEDLKNALREAGAKGTEDSIIYAFGLQLNPDVPSLDTKEILDYLRAFLIFYYWLKQALEVDFTRQITPYVNAFSKKYTRKILDPAYQPSQDDFIDDYLYYNPTRNRALDLLPLMTFLDEKRVMNTLENELIKGRPTFHYRLPNSKVSLKSWSIIKEWNNWVLVEKLAENKEAIEDLGSAYLEYLNDPFYSKQDWLSKINRWVKRIDQNQK